VRFSKAETSISIWSGMILARFFCRTTILEGLADCESRLVMAAMRRVPQFFASGGSGVHEAF